MVVDDSGRVFSCWVPRPRKHVASGSSLVLSDLNAKHLIVYIYTHVIYTYSMCIRYAYSFTYMLSICTSSVYIYSYRHVIPLRNNMYN